MHSLVHIDLYRERGLRLFECGNRCSRRAWLRQARRDLHRVNGRSRPTRQFSPTLRCFKFVVSSWLPGMHLGFTGGFNKFTCLHKEVPLMGGQIKTGNPRFFESGRPREPGNLCQKVPPTFWQGFPAPRGRPDSTNLGFPALILPPRSH